MLYSKSPFFLTAASKVKTSVVSNSIPNIRDQETNWKVLETEAPHTQYHKYKDYEAGLEQVVFIHL